MENRSHSGLANDLDAYTLTIGEASSLMIRERCKFASNRKVQRMCRDGTIDCHKLQTTRNGQPVSEWLVNEASLLRHIEEREIKWNDGEENSPAASGTATREVGNASLPPSVSGNANQFAESKYNPANTGDAVAMPDETGDAGGVTRSAKSVASAGNAMASPDAIGGAIETADEVDWEVGEKRSLASVLIENAKLTAQLEGAHNLIAEVRDDREFLREELKEARSGRKDVTAIAERMLETLESIAIGGKLMPGSRPRNEQEQQSGYQEVYPDHAQSDVPERMEVSDANVAEHTAEENPTIEHRDQPPKQVFPDPSDPQNPFRI